MVKFTDISALLGLDVLTHLPLASHASVNWVNIGSDNGLSPGRRQAIIWTNAGISLIRPLRTNFSEILIEIHVFSFKKMRLKMSSAKKAAILSSETCVLTSVASSFLTINYFSVFIAGTNILVPGL